VTHLEHLFIFCCSYWTFDDGCFFVSMDHYSFIRKLYTSLFCILSTLLISIDRRVRRFVSRCLSFFSSRYHPIVIPYDSIVAMEPCSRAAISNAKLKLELARGSVRVQSAFRVCAHD